MYVRVLGSAAGGGLPQWNCACANCRGVRAGTTRSARRTEASLAVSADGARWFLLNASPAVREQIEAFPPLHARAPRDTPIAGIVLTSGELDHCLGLFVLRESQPLTVWATERVRRGLVEGNVLFRALMRVPSQVTWRALDGESDVELTAGGEPTGLRVRALPVPGRVPAHLAGLHAPHPGDTIGLRIRERGSDASLAYVPGAADVSPTVRALLAGAACAFFDGTFWSDDELVALGLGTARARDMAHLPVGGDGGSLAALATVDVPSRYFTHLNNTNPLVRDDAPERAAVTAAGWRVAADGDEMRL